MSKCKCECRCDCVGLAVVVSIIIGVIAAFLRITAVITLTPAFLWVTFGVPVVYLAVLLLTSSQICACSIRRCICPALQALLIAILGTVLLSVVLLGVEFAATSVTGAVLTGLLIAFFSFVMGATACLIRCILGCSDESDIC